MNRLPSEIINVIARQAERKDLYQFLTINKSWYSVVVDLIYENVRVSNQKQFKSFINTLVRDSRGYLGINVKELDLTGLRFRDKDEVDKIEQDFLDALAWCPNINKITGEANSGIQQVLLHPQASILKKLKSININPYTDYDIDCSMMDCYYKYRSILSYLHLDQYTIAFKYPPARLLTFLTSFSKLEYLNIELPYDIFWNDPMFEPILNQCTHLRRLYFECESIVTADDPPEKTECYPLIEELAITTDGLYLTEVEYMKNHLIYLTKLAIVTNKSFYDDFELLELLVGMKTLDSLEILIRNMCKKETVNAFWHHTSSMEAPVTYQSRFNVFNRTYSTFFSINKCPLTQSKAVACSMSFSHRTRSPYEEYLKDLDGRLDTLEINDCHWNTTVDLNRINMMCPSLSQLSLHGVSITSSPSSYLNPHMSTITMNECTVYDTTFNQVEDSCPMLLELRLISIDYALTPTAGNISYCQLPETGLNSLAIDRKSCQLSSQTLMIMKEVNGIAVNAWYYCKETNKLVMIREGIEDSTGVLSTHQILLLKSSTLENCLPLEVIRFITARLDKSDLHRCLTLNQFWYSISIRPFYSCVELKNVQRLELFLASLTLYPRCMEAGKYIQELDMSCLYSADKFKIFNTEIDIMDALAHCPFIRQLTVCAKPDMIDVVLRTDMKLLNYLFFKNIDYITPATIMDCFYKYRSSLVQLDLNNLTQFVCEYSLEEITHYLGSFPKLKVLSMSILNHLQDVSVLDAVFHQCPQLTEIAYKSASLCTPAESTGVFPLSILTLSLDGLYLNDISYIKSRFNCLKELSLTINVQMEKESEVVDALMAIETLSKLKLDIPNSYSKDTLNTFWKHASLPSEHSKLHPHNKASIKFGCSIEESINLLFTQCPDTGNKIMSSSIYISATVIRESRLEYKSYLEVFGEYLDDLVFYDYDFGHLINLEHINNYCHSLTKLTLMYSKLACTNKSISPNQNLTDLYLTYCTLLVEESHTIQPAFKEIAIAYPKLQRLYLDEPDFINHGTEDMIFEVKLPDTGLKYVSLNKNFIFETPWTSVILNEVDRQPMKMWRYNQKENKTVVNEGEEMADLLRSYPSPLYILKSKTVEDAYVTIVDLYTW
ncbi:hypothetical protein BDB01DRAFT_839114 [Pilobolus umbonatus]|nr:hypothetical protein BDB01DRAFT_839114 [Pilobolus umbonatus]